MDYGLLHQLIFSNPKQADGFWRKLTVYILNAFILEFKSIELIINSKPSEWLNNGGVYPIQYIILLKVNYKKHQLFGTKDPWPYDDCRRSIMIARDLDSEFYSSSNHNLITKDNIKKIISTNIFPKVPLLF